MSESILTRRESLIIALVLKDAGIELDDKALAERISCARAIVDHMLNKELCEASEQAQLSLFKEHNKSS